MQAFKDIPSNLLITLVVVGMSALAEALLKDHPLYVLGAIAFIMLLALQISSWWNAKRLAQKLGIEHERWNKLREQKIKEREIYSKSKYLPARLYELHVLTRNFMKNLRITEKQWKSLEPDMKETFGRFRPFVARIILKIPISIISRIKFLQRFIYKFIFDLDSVLKASGLENLRETLDYKQKYGEIDHDKQGLPNNILTIIDNYIMLSGMLDSMYVFTSAQPFMKKEKISVKTRTALPYLTQAIDAILSPINSKIAHNIEKFLIGE